MFANLPEKKETCTSPVHLPRFRSGAYRNRAWHQDWRLDNAQNGGQNLMMLSRMKWAFWLNLFFAVFEFIGGLWVNSMAIVSDSLHDLGDALSLALGIWLEGKSHTQSDERFSYGYRRFSLLAALITGFVLLLGSIFIFGHSIQRILNPEPVDAPWMMFFAFIGVCVNGLAFFKLRGGGTGHHHHHHHHHGHHHHDHDHSAHKPEEAGSLHMKMWELHFIEDILGWVLVFFGAILIHFYQIFWLDGALAVLLSLWIGFNVFKNLKATFTILLQGAPSVELTHEISKFLSSMTEISSFHHFHVWSLDGEKHILTGHIVLAKDYPFTQVSQLKKRIKAGFAEKMNIAEATLEFEWEGEACADPSHQD